MAHNDGPRPDLDLICGFVNTRGILASDPYAKEEIGTAQALARWWHGQGLDIVEVGDRDVEEAHVTREGLRALMGANNGSASPADPAALAAFGALAGVLHLRVDPGGTTVLRPTETATARTGLSWLLVALTNAHSDGTWKRAKVCADPNCREAFTDTTRNHSRTWCSMQVCGARAKQRTFAERHNTTPGKG
nr:CGNR zinc finger domain-containing protein [Kibdelosporangium sp. MJ126-NF4]CEL21347.1 hypothetical protein [Kibdelosporangium sp. MJ126-NF4]CTQ96086.1 hypothetical protein [Kibdelosporangium sp. MJ126-NF4]